MAPSWVWTLWISGLIGIAAYGAAFVLALGLDQPFGPVLVAVCLALVGLAGGLSFPRPRR